MEWTGDVALGDWLRERIDDPWRGTMHDVVPRGFAAYARVFHPASRARPVGREWPPLPYLEHEREWEAFARDQVEIETEPATWAEAARAFGTRMHPLAQWGALVRARGAEWDPNGWQQTQAPDGWQFDAPTEGRLDAATLAVVASHLAAYTTTPDEGVVALWEGHGGLLGFYGDSPSRALLIMSTDPDDDADVTARHRAMLGRSVHDQFENAFRTPKWQPGVLPDEVSNGPRLELPARGHVLFRGGVAELTDAAWPYAVPWGAPALEAPGLGGVDGSPSLVWPDDRAWVLVTEVDYDSTIIAGSAGLVAALCADPRLEALPIPEGADLSWDGDEVNR